MSIVATLDLPVEPQSSEADIVHIGSNNPAPTGGIYGFQQTPDGMQLRYARWQTQVRPLKGTVILLHGRSEFIEKYFETAEDLLKRGFDVLTFDWRGQGLSTRVLRDRKKGHITHFDQYLTDLDTMLNEIALPDCRGPIYIMAHSTGGLVALLAAPALANRIERMVLVSPLLELNKIPMDQSVLQRITGVLTFLGMGRAYITPNRASSRPKPFISNLLTSDPDRYRRTVETLEAFPDLRLGGPTIAWVFAACRAMAQVRSPEFSNAVSIPTLMVAAGNDAVVTPSVIEEYGQAMRAGSFLTIPGARHEVLMEDDLYREPLLAAFDAFIPGGDA